jgi:hypothetical protein
MSTATSITVRVPLSIRRRPGRKTVVTPLVDGMAAATTGADPALVKALARAFRYGWMSCARNPVASAANDQSRPFRSRKTSSADDKNRLRSW